MSAPRREILKARTSSQLDVADLLQGAFATELLVPSTCVWLVSPWISDLAVIDNRAHEFDVLEPSWGAKQVRLSEVLMLLMMRGSHVCIVCRPDEHNKRFLAALSARVRIAGVDARVEIHQREIIHLKGLLTDTFYLSGSMNFTHNGVALLEESVRFDCDPELIAHQRHAFHDAWGGVLRPAESRG